MLQFSKSDLISRTITFSQDYTFTNNDYGANMDTAVSAVVSRGVMLTIEGELPYKTFTLQPAATIKFTLNDNSYHLENVTSKQLVIENIISLVNVCQFLKVNFPNKGMNYIPPCSNEVIAHLATYQNMNIKLINLFGEQNNMDFNCPRANGMLINWLYLRDATHPSETEENTSLAGVGVTEKDHPTE